MSAEFIARLPLHEAGLSLDHNPHRNYYETVDQWDADRRVDWVADDERQKAVEANEVWVLQWYPGAPIGFHRYAASTLEALLAFAQRFQP